MWIDLFINFNIQKISEKFYYQRISRESFEEKINIFEHRGNV